MKRFFKRISALFVSAALMVSLMIVPVFAVVGIDDVLFSSFVGALVGYLVDRNIDVAEKDVAKLFSPSRYEGTVVSAERLQQIANELDNDLYQTFKQNGLVKTMQNWYWTAIEKDPAHNNVARIYNKLTNQWFVLSDGSYPYCSESAWDTFKGEPLTKPSASNLTGKLVDERSISYNNYILESQSYLLSISNTQNLPFVQRTIKKDGKSIDVYVVGKATSSTLMVYCNAQGYPYVAYKDTGSSALGNSTTNNYNQVIDKTTNSPTYNQTTNIYNTTTGPDYSGILMDINNGVLNIYDELGNLDTQDIYNVSYDYSDHSYNVTTYNTTYNTTNNHYDYEFNTYNIQYTYNNTYITYIGSTAEYQPKEWELYYELPDGRSSADLTEEDVAGLSFQFADCINYKKSATDTRLRVLYHFDGNVNDVSYFSNKTSFTWNTGASITYMESNAFNGALYLDEKEHQFTVTLPSNIGSSDFTLQWRYYQNNATTSNHNENYVTIGGQKVLGWSENYLYNGSGTQLAGISVGTWQELALVRSKGTLYIYHNGVKIGSVAFASVLSNNLVFYFGPNSRGYSMLDELRFVKGALYTGGEAYTPTTVPYDTNQVLVLPDSSLPVADAYWYFDKTITSKYKWNFTDGSVSPVKATTSNGYFTLNEAALSKLHYFSNYLTGFDDYVHFSHEPVEFSPSELPTRSFYSGRSDSLPAPISSASFKDCCFIPLFFCGAMKDRFINVDDEWETSSNSNKYGSLLSGIYTITAVFKDGSVVSATQDLGSSSWASPGYYSGARSALFDLSTSTDSLKITFFLKSSSWSKSYDSGAYTNLYSSFSGLLISGVCDLVYLEICQGAQGNTNHQYVTAIYDSEDIRPNTAAIQTDIPINGYTVGGVRPTFPVRGDVWFPVEGSRISGVQIYNGQAWIETNARWWTGSRWIPIYAFDLVTLADMWDVSSSEGADVNVTPPITSESGFWNWWKKSWNDFTNKLFGVLQPGSGPGGSGSGSGSGSGRGFFEKILDALADGLSSLIKGLFEVITEIFKMLLSVVTDMLSAIFNFVTDTVLGGISSFFSFFTDGSLFEFFQSDPDSEGVALPEGIATVFSVFSGIIMLLPWELRSLLIFGIAAAVLISVFKFVKA